jgi:formamidopyrimidine-DNA glycosylase
MPELPEVEVTRLSFAEKISGSTILSVFMGKPLRWPLECQKEALIGLKVLQVRRRGKYLLLDLSQGMLMVHLGMSGSLSFATQLPNRGIHDHFELSTSQGILRLNDPRRFGAVVFAESQFAPNANKLLGRLGVEPLSDAFEMEAFFWGLKQRKTAIKSVLLAGELVVGVGNIYASEALFMAGIRPTRRAFLLSRKRVVMLHAAIKEVLLQAVAKGGSTLRDFSSAEGKTGYFQLQANVYGREGQPCRVCAKPIKMIRQGQRATFFCPVCQKN